MGTQSTTPPLLNGLAKESRRRLWLRSRKPLRLDLDSPLDENASDTKGTDRTLSTFAQGGATDIATYQDPITNVALVLDMDATTARAIVVNASAYLQTLALRSRPKLQSAESGRTYRGQAQAARAMPTQKRHRTNLANQRVVRTIIRAEMELLQVEGPLKDT